MIVVKEQFAESNGMDDHTTFVPQRPSLRKKVHATKKANQRVVKISQIQTMFFSKDCHCFPVKKFFGKREL